MENTHHPRRRTQAIFLGPGTRQGATDEVTGLQSRVDAFAADAGISLTPAQHQLQNARAFTVGNAQFDAGVVDTLSAKFPGWTVTTSAATLTVPLTGQRMAVATGHGVIAVLILLRVACVYLLGVYVVRGGC
jgi:hypothetical protein